jgi:hypothetical protein
MTSVIKVDTIQNSSGTSALSIDGSGNIYPKGLTYLPAACVSLTTANTQDTSDPFTTTGVAIKFDEVFVNKGNVYNATTGKFTAPIAGLYEVSGHVLKDNGSTNTFWNFYKNGVNTGYGGYSGQSAYAATSGKMIIELAADDEITIVLGGGGIQMNGPSNDNWNTFTFQYIG